MTAEVTCPMCGYRFYGPQTSTETTKEYALRTSKETTQRALIAELVTALEKAEHLVSISMEGMVCLECGFSIDNPDDDQPCECCAGWSEDVTATGAVIRAALAKAKEVEG